MTGKNKIIVLLLAALLLAGCEKGDSEQSPEISESSVVSDISYVSEAEAESDFSEVSDESDASEVIEEGVRFEYDDEGRPTKKLYFDADGNLEYYREYSYGGKKLSHITAYSPDGQQIGVTDYVYNGDAIEKTIELDAHSNVTRVTYYNQDGDVDRYTEYTRDGDEITEVSRRADGSLLATFDFLCSDGYYSFFLMSEYAKNGDIPAKTVLAHDMGDRYAVLKYEYDEKGREVKCTAMGGFFWNGIVYSYVNQYDGDLLSAVTWYDYRGTPVMQRKFDSDGRAVSDCYLNADGSVGSFTITGEWDDENRPVKAGLYNNVDALIGDVSYVYREDGRQTCEITYDLDGHKLKERTFTYELYGRLSAVGETRFDKNGLPTYSLVRYYETMCAEESDYDDRGRVVKSSQYRFDSTLLSYTLMEYNENGNLKKRMNYDEKGVFTGGSEYEYNADGALIKEVNLDADKNVMGMAEYQHIEADGVESRTDYNADGQKICYVEYAEDGDGNFKEAHRFEYQNGELISHTVTEEVGGLTIYCLYDANGELVRKYYYDESGYCGTPIVIQ